MLGVHYAVLNEDWLDGPQVAFACDSRSFSQQSSNTTRNSSTRMISSLRPRSQSRYYTKKQGVVFVPKPRSRNNDGVAGVCAIGGVALAIGGVS
jgi:hypothetical protein